MERKIDPTKFLNIKFFSTEEDLNIKGGCKDKVRQKVKQKGDLIIIRDQVKVKGC